MTRRTANYIISEPDRGDDLKRRGATLVAITPQRPEHSLSIMEKHKISFDILSDPGNAYAPAL